MLRTVVLVGITVAGCGRERAPQPRPLPKIDANSALRGGGPPRSPRNASYKLQARLDPARHQVEGSETLTWTNTGQSTVSALPFHLYLNGFKNEQSLFMRSSRGVLRGAHASDTGWGYIQIESVHVGGVDLTSAFQPVREYAPDETVAELALPQPIAPGGTIEISFKFLDQLPEVFARTGYKGEFNMVGQWFPKIGVRTGPPGNEHWDCQPFHANNEFFADFGTYDVELTVPATHTVAATGVLTKAVDSHGWHTLTYHADDVHDFAWMADPYMEVMSRQAKLADGTVEVRVYYRPEQSDFAARHLEAATGAIEQFSELFVPYPWSIMSVIDPPVDAAAGAGGMEYPTLVTTGGDSVLARPGIRIPEFTTVHEVGHNWFQGMLASNEPEEAWLDEGVNVWADMHAMARIYRNGPDGIDWMGWQAELSALLRASEGGTGDSPSPIATPAYAFVDGAAYGEQSYTATMRALETLENLPTVGSQKLLAAMKVYAKRFAFSHPTGRDLFDTLASELHQDLSWYFDPVFHQVGGVALSVRHAGCVAKRPARGVFGEGSARHVVSETEAKDTGTWSCDVIVQSTGRVLVPVDIELKFADGSTELFHWDDHASTTWRTPHPIERSSPLVEVWIDPAGEIALDNPMTHHYRVIGDGAASLRAGAWFGSLAQTAMQLVGP